MSIQFYRSGTMFDSLSIDKCLKNKKQQKLKKLYENIYECLNLIFIEINPNKFLD